MSQHSDHLPTNGRRTSCHPEHPAGYATESDRSPDSQIPHTQASPGELFEDRDRFPGIDGESTENLSPACLAAMPGQKVTLGAVVDVHD